MEAMAVQKLSVLFPACFSILTLSSGMAFAGDGNVQPTIPTGYTPVTTVATQPGDDSREDDTRSFNTPTDDGRPGEYYFVLGVQAVKRGDYEHAMAMYKVSASWAYKPAEYNLGVMYLSGQGTPVDLPRALAWMALAAERGEAQYVRGRQLVYAHLTPAQYDQANVIWRDLLPTYGDEAALPRAKARWREARINATGSRVGSSAAHVMVGGADGTPNHMNNPNYDGSGHVSENPAELAGVHQGDGAVAYQALRTTDDPYDPKVMPVSGSATIGPLTQVNKGAGDTTKDQSTKKDTDAVTHP
jgi:hypothetical protein